MKDVQSIAENLIGQGSAKIKSLTHSEEFIPRVCIINHTKEFCLAYREIKTSTGLIELYKIEELEESAPYTVIKGEHLLKMDSDLLLKDMVDIYLNESFTEEELYKFGIALLGLHQLRRVKIFAKGVEEVVSEVSKTANKFDNVNVIAEISKLLHKIGDLRDDEEEQFREVELEIQEFYRTLGIQAGLLSNNEEE